MGICRSRACWRDTEASYPHVRCRLSQAAFRRGSGKRRSSGHIESRYARRCRRPASDFTIDTRTATEYGVLRTFFDAAFSWTSGSYAGNGAGGTFYSGAAQAGVFGGVGNPSDGGLSGGSLGVHHAFIQFAGFTMGKTISQFDTSWVNYPGNNFDGLVGGSGMVTGVNQLTFIGVLKVDQAWGMFQLSAVAHNLHAAYYGGTEPTGHPSAARSHHPLDPGEGPDVLG